MVRSLALALVALLVACSSPAPSASPSAVAQPSPTPSPTPPPTPTPPVYWPLRGTLASSAEAIAKRPVLVRIPNDTGARPQSGLSKADMVWELLAEGGITRYMAVYHSEEADSIGPIRSGRLSDLHYAPMLRGILAHVGASGPVLQRIRAAAARGEFVDVDQFLYSSYYTRITQRLAPQNVYTSTARLREAAKAAGDTGNVQVPTIEWLRGSSGGASRPAGATFTIPYLGAMAVQYRDDQVAGGWARVQGGAATVDAITGKPVVATNVVVIFTDITPQPDIIEDANNSPSLEVRSTGAGKVSVFQIGQRVDGTWSRQGLEMYRFAAVDGRPIQLMPGQTWVHVVPADWTVTSAP